MYTQFLVRMGTALPRTYTRTAGELLDGGSCRCVRSIRWKEADPTTAIT